MFNGWGFKGMRKFTLLTMLVSSILGIIYLETPKDDFATIVDSVIVAYYKSQYYVQENPDRMVPIGCGAVTTLIWIGILIFGRSNKATKTIPEKKSESIASATKDKQTGDWLISVQYEERQTEAVERAKARSLNHQLHVDKCTLEGRQKWMPEELSKAERELDNARDRMHIAEETLQRTKDKFRECKRRLDELLKESDKNEKELKDIQTEIDRLKTLI